jgi:anti-sigma B factor antagonist
MASLVISERRSGKVVIVSLAGRLVPDQEDLIFRNFIDALVERGVTSIVVDLHDVVLLDSGGIGVLVAKLHTLRSRGGDLRLARLTARTHRLLEITHLLTVFANYDSIQEAVESFGVTAPPFAHVHSRIAS